MSYICPICNIMPSSHSLTKVLETTEIVYYYTCPSKAVLYNDVHGIITHYDGVLSEIPENKEWIWIFDGLHFGFIHVIETSVAIELAKLISSKFSKNLKKIIIINPTIYINIIHDLLMPFLNTKLKHSIEMNYTITSVEDLLK